MRNQGQTAVDAITNYETVATKLEEAIALSDESDSVLQQANVSMNAVQELEQTNYEVYCSVYKNKANFRMLVYRT